MRVWRASDLSLVRVLRGHRGSVLCLLAVGNVLLSGARDNTIRYVCVCVSGVFKINPNGCAMLSISRLNSCQAPVSSKQGH